MKKRPKLVVKKMSSREASREYIDYDYLNQLDYCERRWLDQFTAEYYGDYFDPGRLSV